MAISIIDAFVYSGEPIAELRLAYLSPYVSRFVVVADDTHVNDTVFQPYWDKITFVSPVCGGAGEEPFDAAQSYIHAQYQDYIVMACDVGEIPSIATVQELPSRYFGLQDPIRFETTIFASDFFHHASASAYDAFCINDMGIMRHGTFTDIRSRAHKTLYIPQSGWAVRDYIGMADASQEELYDVRLLPTEFQRFNEKLVFLQKYARE
jgi:hypothetical protein